MASTATALPATAPHLLSTTNKQDDILTTPKPRDVFADFNYYKDLGDGKPPTPSYVGKPETYDRPCEARTMIVHDIRGEEDKYTLDSKGFQIYKHVSQEAAFEDDDEIKKVYYPEIEGILKDAYVLPIILYLSVSNVVIPVPVLRKSSSLTIPFVGLPRESRVRRQRFAAQSSGYISINHTKPAQSVCNIIYPPNPSAYSKVATR